MPLNIAIQQALKVALIYFIVAAGWILFSDELLKCLVHDADARIKLSIVKGWIFVLVTGSLLYFYLQHLLRRWEREVEQRKESEAASRAVVQKLRQSEEQLRLVLAGSADGVWDLDCMTGVAELNPRYWEIIGYEPGEVVPDMAFFQRLVHPDDWPGALATMTDHLAGKTTQSSFEYRLLTKDGTVKWMWGRGKVAARAADGTPLRMTGTISDITERKLAERRGADAVKYAQTLLTASPIAIITYKASGEAVSANEAAAKLVGTTVEKLQQQNFRALESWKQSKLFELAEWALATGQEQVFENFHVSTFGVEAWTACRCVPFQFEGEAHLLLLSEDISQGKRAEQSLRESERFLQSTLDALSSHVAILDEHGTIIKVNAAWNRFARDNDLSRDAVGEHYLHLCDAATGDSSEGAAAAAAGIRKILAGQGDVRDVFELEYPCHSPQKQRWFNLRVTRFVGEGPLRVVVAHENISARKQAEMALQGSEQLLRTVMDLVPHFIFVKDSQSRLILVNQAYAVANGLTPKQMNGKSDLDFVADRSQAEIFMQNDREVIASGQPKLIAEESFTNAAGESRILQTIKIPFTSPGGGLALVGVAMDITESKQAAQILRESEEAYRQLFELESDAIVLVDHQTHRFVEVNLSAQKLYGYRREEFLSLTAEQVSAEPEKTRATVDAGTVFVALRWHRKKNGQRFPVEITASVIQHQGRRMELTAIRDITARQQALEILQDTTTQLLDAQRIANLGSYVLDMATERWTCSQVMDELFGIADAGFTKDLNGWLEIVHPDERAKLWRYWNEQVLQRKLAFDYTYRIVRQNDRQERTVHGLGKLVLDDRGQVVKMVGIIQDVTEQKRAEEAKARLAMIVESSNDCIIGKNLNGIITSWNHGAEKIFGYTASEMIGASILRLIPADRQADENQILDRIKRGESVEHFETVRLTKDGKLIEMSVTASPIKDVSGEVIGVSKVARDITEQKRVEAQLHLQSSALVAAANGIVITDHHGKIEWVNPSFTRLTGYSAAEAVGNNPRMLKSGEHPLAFYANLWASIITGNIWHGELVNKRKDGRLFTVETTITPVRGTDGQITHFVAIKQDVTERRKLENQLRQAQKMEAIGTLAGGIAHDFNNMLGAMFGFGYLLQQDTAGNAEAQESIAEILKAATRAKDLVQQILTFSRRGEQTRQFVRLDTVVKEAVKFLRASLPAQIKIEMNLAGDTPTVLADPTQIYQVTMNLATNAQHAMADRPGKLTVTLDVFQPDEPFLQAHPGFRPVEYVRLTVADTGSGMDAKTLERIYEPFFTTKPVGQGTGLGLSVVHGIVESHEGKITVASVVGQGTTFSLYFPAKTSPAALTETKALEVNPGQGQSILLLDDEPALTAAFRRLLERLNNQVTICNSAREAVALFRKNPAQFDLVITDLTMPEMNGLEVARQIHAVRPDLPVILASGLSVDLNGEQLRDAGIFELIKKPVSYTALTDVLHRVFGKSKRI